MLSITPGGFTINFSDWDLGQALAADVRGRHKERFKTAERMLSVTLEQMAEEVILFERSSPYGSRMGWTDSFADAFPNDTALANAANLLMDRRENPDPQ